MTRGDPNEIVVIGTCTNDGCVPTRVLAHAARLARDARMILERFGQRLQDEGGIG